MTKKYLFEKQGRLIGRTTKHGQKKFYSVFKEADKFKREDLLPNHYESKEETTEAIKRLKCKSKLKQQRIIRKR